MSAGCLRWVLRQAVRGVCAGRSSGSQRAPSRYLLCNVRRNVIAPSCRWSLFSTTVDDVDEVATAKKKKKEDPRARVTINNVGRKIQQRQLQVISEIGENLGTMHRADVIRIMDEQGLKLVLLSDKSDPPVYQLMSGKQIHEEQLRLREKQKAKAGPLSVKELTFSSDIGPRDLITKLKQVQSWLEKKNHVKMILRSGRARSESAISLDSTLEQMVQQMEIMVGFVSKPQVIRDGKAAVCVVRPPSAKELAQMGKNKKIPASKNEDSIMQPDQPKASDEKPEGKDTIQ